MKKIISVLALAVISISLFSVMSIAPASAQDDILGMDYANNFGLTNAQEQDPRQMAINIVRYIMTFLGIIAVVIILLGGFKWMTAAGNEDKVGEAKKLIIAGIIGLIIILAAFAIVTFVVGMTNSALNGEING